MQSHHRRKKLDLRHLLIKAMIDPKTKANGTPLEIGLMDKTIAVILGHAMNDLVLRSLAEVEPLKISD